MTSTEVVTGDEAGAAEEGRGRERERGMEVSLPPTGARGGREREGERESPATRREPHRLSRPSSGAVVGTTSRSSPTHPAAPHPHTPAHNFLFDGRTVQNGYRLSSAFRDHLYN